MNILFKDKKFLEIVKMLANIVEINEQKNACILVNNQFEILNCKYTGFGGNYISKRPEIECVNKSLIDQDGISVCYTDKSPCLEAVQLLIKSDCHAIIFNHRGSDHDDAMRLWLSDTGGFRMWEENIK